MKITIRGYDEFEQLPFKKKLILITAIIAIITLPLIIFIAIVVAIPIALSIVIIAIPIAIVFALIILSYQYVKKILRKK